MKQFKVGYIVDAISNLIVEKHKPLNYFTEKKDIEINSTKGLLESLSAFDVQFPYHHEVKYDQIHPVLATINNVITRGLPTKAPISIEKKFFDLGLTRKSDNTAIEFKKATFDLDYNTVFELLHVIDPSFNINEVDYIGELGSKLENKFLNSHPFVMQLFQSQRDLSTLVEEIGGGRSVDFSFTSPYLHWNEVKNRTENNIRIFEIDGPHHAISEYVHYDTKRDVAAADNGIETLRITDKQIYFEELSYENLFTKEIYKIFEKNYKRTFSEFLKEYSLIFIPFAVARIQKTIIEHFILHEDLFGKETISIVIIERDLPCAGLAIEGLKEYFENLNALLKENSKLKLPNIKLSIIENKSWVFNEELHCGFEILNEDTFNPNDFDVILDHSILRRSQLFKEKKYDVKNRSIIIRSTHYFDHGALSSKKVYCSKLLNYHEFVIKQPNGTYINRKEFETHINFFVQNIFRKEGFRNGQLPIISRSLQMKPVIGLLPTGGGKSLTYQLPVLLQPGLCLIVDPIKSLMEDQVRVLHNNWIDCCAFINSNLKREEKQIRLIDLKQGQTQFLFVSPERLVIQDFRNIVQTIDNNDFKLAFSFCVIDEVHCLSEWGHDFRTTYLMLGKNAQTFVKTKENKVTLIGLTATASYDVLADIERELDIEHDDVANALISIDNTIRKELFFDFVDCNAEVKDVKIKDKDIKSKIGALKQEKLNSYIQSSIINLNFINEKVIRDSLKQHYEEFELEELTEKEKEDKINEATKLILAIPNDLTPNKSTSIIFCPHREGSLGVTGKLKKPEGTTAVFEKLKIDDNNKSFFIGNDESGKLDETIQNHFLNFMNSKTHYMVCTKAFGMGIDKEDVRAVYHINYSSSPESYIQEAGRAGRDKKKSLCVNLVSNEVFHSLNPQYLLDFNIPINARRQLRNLFESLQFHDGKYRFIGEKYQNKELLTKEIGSIMSGFLESYEKEIKVNGETKTITIETILTYNLDESTHQFFHNNSFKGMKTEMFQLKRFFNRVEQAKKTVFKQITDAYNIENKREIDFYLTPAGPHQGNIWLKTEEKIKFGRIIRTKGIGNLTVDFNHILPEGCKDIPLTNDIFNYITTKWKETSPETTLFEYLNQPAHNVLNDGQSLKEYFITKQSGYIFTVPLDYREDDLSKEIISDFELVLFADGKIPHVNLENYINTLQSHSLDFKDFIQRVEETWDLDIFNDVKFRELEDKYEELYYSNINRQDLFRIIYRLYSIKFVKDYTIDYNKELVTIYIDKQDKEFYIQGTRNHLLKYLSKENTNKKIEELEKKTIKKDVPEAIMQCIKVILGFTYNDIVAKRKQAMTDMKSFIKESIDHNTDGSFDFKNAGYNKHFKQLMYYYFNAKYAKKGFVEGDEPRSLMDDFINKKPDIFDKYTKILNGKSSFINECKMMRASCKRIWREQSEDDLVDEYDIKLLYAFASYGINNPLYFEDATEYFLKGFELFYSKHHNFEMFENKIIEFEEKLAQSVKYPFCASFIRVAKHQLMLKIKSEELKISLSNLIEI
ncbi:MAG: DEAD/DEAH box helicase [Flavobacterium sp.]